MAFYASDKLTVYPASNILGSGKLFTELNGRNANLNITDTNYIISPYRKCCKYF